jgi:hypothetical protein
MTVKLSKKISWVDDYYLTLVMVFNVFVPDHKKLTEKEMRIIAYMLEHYTPEMSLDIKGTRKELMRYFRFSDSGFGLHLTHLVEKEWIANGKVTPNVYKLRDYFPNCEIVLNMAYEQQPVKASTRKSY